MVVPFDERSDDLPSQFGSAWNWWAVYCAPQSCRSPRPRAIRGAYAAMWVRTPCRTGSCTVRVRASASRASRPV